MSQIKVLVVDDSATMRRLITSVLMRDSGIMVVGEAADPIEARAAIKALNPDVVTLDIEMPNMSGLDFLEKIMRLRPMPVVMVSTLTQSGAEATIQALELGAVDCVGKPAGTLGAAESFAGLPGIVRAASTAQVRALEASAVTAGPDRAYAGNGDVVAIGSSTGGVEALISVLSSYPRNAPATVITQHMPAAFTASFAARLDRSCAASVREAYDGAPIEPGRVWLAPGGAAHLEVARGLNGLVCRLSPRDPVNGHRPSVDVLFRSMADVCGAQALGVILTGMGRDGADGLLAMSQAGARTIGQDEASCVVYGMPRTAWEAGGVQVQLPLTRIGQRIIDSCRAVH